MKEDLFLDTKDLIIRPTKFEVILFVNVMLEIGLFIVLIIRTLEGTINKIIVTKLFLFIASLSI